MPINAIDHNGDSIILDKSITDSKSHMEAYNKWTETKSGQKFIKKYGIGGKFEHISIVFNVSPLDDTGEDGHGQTVSKIVNKETGKERDLPSVENIPNGKDLVSGKDKSEYLKFYISLDTKDLKTDRTKLAKAKMLNTIVHETQHMSIELLWLNRQNAVPGSYQQHDIMYRGEYKQERIDTFKEIEDWWLYDYNNKWKTKTTKEQYIIDKINSYDW